MVEAEEDTTASDVIPLNAHKNNELPEKNGKWYYFGYDILF